ncbi:MAG TPA: hypothetical protein PKJ19_05335 [Flavobacteriales bacterium]|nr:hypothetical protein [Flavobacteriales bacterium]
MDNAALAIIKLVLLISSSMFMLVFLVQCASFVGMIVTPLKGVDRGRVQLILPVISIALAYLSTLF